MMMNTNKIFIVLILVLFSCNSKNSLKDAYKVVNESKHDHNVNTTNIQHQVDSVFFSLNVLSNNITHDFFIDHNKKNCIVMTKKSKVSTNFFSTENIEESIKVKITPRFLKLITLNEKYKLAFKDSIKEFEANYCSPILISNTDTVSINVIGEELSCGFTGNFICSPNCEYVVLERIERGFIENEYHENYFCWLVNLRDQKVIEQFQSYCGGEWNKNNQWIDDGKVVFSPI